MASEKTSVENLLDAADALSAIAASIKPGASTESIMASCAALDSAAKAVSAAKLLTYDGSASYKRIYGSGR
jgi:hypothetical protein